ncbi:hypothetical protein FRX31_020824, partial [Thalictrum thalictroides]
MPLPVGILANVKLGGVRIAGRDFEAATGRVQLIEFWELLSSWYSSDMSSLGGVRIAVGCLLNEELVDNFGDFCPFSIG